MLIVLKRIHKVYEIKRKTTDISFIGFNRMNCNLSKYVVNLKCVIVKIFEKGAWQGMVMQEIILASKYSSVFLSCQACFYIIQSDLRGVFCLFFHGRDAPFCICSGKNKK